MHAVITTIVLMMLALTFGGCRKNSNDEINQNIKIKGVHKIEGHDGTNLNREKIDITQMAPPDKRRTVEGLTGRSIKDKKNTGSDTEHTDLKGRKLF